MDDGGQGCALVPGATAVDPARPSLDAVVVSCFGTWNGLDLGFRARLATQVPVLRLPVTDDSRRSRPSWSALCHPCADRVDPLHVAANMLTAAVSAIWWTAIVLVYGSV
jgi:hypothetical protein